jgi:antitoxin (DNA-binding transcriptional repressor) of toxin-antitoxin stability system
MAEQSPVTPVLTADNCKAELPAWGVTRDFRFGQFIRLYDERLIAGRRHTTPIVLTVDGDITETPAGAQRSLRSTADGSPAISTASGSQLKAIGLDVLASGADVADLISGQPEHRVSVTDLAGLLTGGTLEIEGRPVAIDVGPVAAARLQQGESVLALARGTDGDSGRIIRLDPRIATAELPAAELDAALADRLISTAEGMVELDEPAIRSLLTTGGLIGTARQNGTATSLVRIRATPDDDGSEARPLATALVIAELAEFLMAPVIPATGGDSLIVDLDIDAIRELRRGNPVTVQVGGELVTLLCPGPRTEIGEEYLQLGRAIPIDPTQPPLGRRPTREQLKLLTRELGPVKIPWDHGEPIGSGPFLPVDTTPPEPPKLAKEGLPVAVLLPWKQTWTLKGFSRGNLLSTLALAPGEDTTITVSSWERRSKALNQSAETDIEQTFDFTSTTRDTEDVFREVTSSNEFNAQAHGSLDASYSPGVASIRVQAGGQVGNTNSLANACRTSTNHVRESTNRASTRVRARRITTITESIETETRTLVVRHIRNPNECHTLTMNFHEVIAHYDIGTEFLKDAVRIVVLVSNPVEVKTFDELTVRVNEATLRTNLIDQALSDGFEACRLLESYRNAELELIRLSSLAKAEKELDRERTQAPVASAQTQPTKPENPQLAPLKAILNDLKRRAALGTGADVGAALAGIASPAHVAPAAQAAAGQRWLWRRLVAAKFGTGLIAELDRLAGATVGPDLARSLLSAMPPLGSVPALDALSGLGDKDKEDAGLAARIKNMPGYIFWDWDFWYSNCKRFNLYDAQDDGIPGALAQLKTTFQAWEAKESEGAGLQAAAAVVAQASQEQAAATLADRLEMKFGVETIGAAIERSQALRTHLNQHRDYYRYVLFQALPPSEQLQRLMEAAPQLRVGMFEPRVVASDGPNLAIPLSPLAETTLMKVVTNLATELEKAATDAQAAGDKIAVDSVILPTPGVTVESWVGECSAAEPHLRGIQAAELRSAVAQARQSELEADRRSARLEAKDLSDPAPENATRLHVDLVGDH